VLRHGPGGLAERVLGATLADTGGGWRVPERAAATVDVRYLLFAIGLLADSHPAAAAHLAGSVAAGDIRSLG
jgi:hypothetical protein